MSDPAATSRFVGVLMLDTSFPRMVGDAGNLESYPFPARISVVSGAGANQIVTSGGPQDRLLPAFIAAARRLEAEGAVALVSTCGFLVHFQADIARAVNVPVLVSALSLFPLLRVAFGERPIAVLTASADSLKGGALAAAKIDPSEVRIAGFEACPAFAEPILNGNDASEFDTETITCFAVERARALIAADPEIGCFLLECGNLPPYAQAIRAATGRPVIGILDAARMLWTASEHELFGGQ